MKKTYTWDGKKVSRTTYFRMKRKLPLAKGSSKAVAEAVPVSTSVPDVDYGKAPIKTRVTLGGVQIFEDTPPKDHPSDAVDEALLRDFMEATLFKDKDIVSKHIISIQGMRVIPPRLWLAIIRYLDRMGFSPVDYNSPRGDKR